MLLQADKKNTSEKSLKDKAREVSGIQLVADYEVMVSILGERPACFLCNKPHLARDCPEKDDMKHKMCYYC